VLKYLQVEENEELARVIHSKWMDFVDCAIYPEVREVLQGLKRRGVKVGLISNGYEEEINLVLDKAALEAAAFDVIVGVDTVGKVKPDPDIFQYALKKLNVKPEEAIFVGDNVEADYEGARNVGIHALLIRRTGTPQSDVETVKSLNEVLHQVG
jgi:putative hydrolase of the HAD superfamily